MRMPASFFSAFLIASACLFAAPASARSVYMQPSPEMGPPPPLRDRHAPSVIWEAAFYLESQQMFGKQVRPIEARWVRRFTNIGLGVGFGLGAVPESIVDRYTNPVTQSSYRRARTALWGGLVIDQMLWGQEGYAPYLAVELGVGAGKIFQRREPPNLAVESKDAHIAYVEPALYGTLFTYANLDFGARISSRIMSLHADEVGESGDVSGLVWGLIARCRL